MGISSRLFKCNTVDLEQLRRGERDGDDYESSPQMKGVTSLHLCIIWAAIDGVEWDPEIHEGTALTEVDPWIEHLPPSMVVSFRSVSDARASSVATDLAPTEDFGWEPEEVLGLIKSVREFATRANESLVCLETSL